ncbi:helix-turn-helix transcriptional regulator [Ornithinimicrobium faecis]|uniref:helix-turn-helix transcriptional regulator n=1 Tax=Ornithinimicrobium faecis TaxID=2934158 RepID=UPI0031F2F191
MLLIVCRLIKCIWQRSASGNDPCVPYDERLQARLRALGNAVREARTAAGLSQEGLADRAGMHRTYVGSVERGERTPTVGTLYTLADALEAEVYLLIGNER